MAGGKAFNLKCFLFTPWGPVRGGGAKICTPAYVNTFLPCLCFSISPTGTIPRALGMIFRCLISLFEASKCRRQVGKFSHWLLCFEASKTWPYHEELQL